MFFNGDGLCTYRFGKTTGIVYPHSMGEDSCSVPSVRCYGSQLPAPCDKYNSCSALPHSALATRTLLAPRI